LVFEEVHGWESWSIGPTDHKPKNHAIGWYTVAVALARSDAKLLLVAAGGVIVAGLLVAAVLLLATGRASSPSKYEPFDAGVAASIRKDLKDGGPYFVADPFGGDRSILLALEEGKIVALSDIKPGTKDCRVRWRGSIDSFVDCNDRKLQSTDLARYPSEVGKIGDAKGELFIDLRHREPAPAASSN
jgi:hypothetical protein